MNNRHRPNWICPDCGELIPHDFLCCWNCGTDELGQRDPNFVSLAEPPSPPAVRVRFGWLGMIAWTAVCGILLMLATWLDRWLPGQWSVRLAGILGLFLFGLLAGVIVNLIAQAYPVLSEYFHPRDAALVQLTESRSPEAPDNEPRIGP